MLPAQVSYWTLQEQKRHNLETERLTGVELAERARHNQEDERIRVGTLAEQQRNNLYINNQGDYSLGLNAQDTATRRFAAVAQANYQEQMAKSGRMQATASLRQAAAAGVQASAAMSQAASAEKLATANAALSNVRAEQEKMTGAAERRNINAQTDYTYARTATEGYRPLQIQAETAQTEKNTELADFYAGDRARQTDIQQMHEINYMGNSILSNLTPWQ